MSVGFASLDSHICFMCGYEHSLWNQKDQESNPSSSINKLCGLGKDLTSLSLFNLIKGGDNTPVRISVRITQENA